MLFVVFLALLAASVETSAMSIPDDFLFTMISPSVDASLKVGDDLNLTCECTSKTADLKMVRIGNMTEYRTIGDNLTETTVESSRFFWSRKTLVYTISDAKLSDAGEYTCMASNKGKTMVYQPGIEVRVFDKTPPKIKFSSGKNGLLMVNYKNQVTLECEAQGYPPPSMKWFKEGEHVASNVKVTTGIDFRLISLIVRDFNLGDAGKYTCEASNINGHAKADVTVSLKEYSPKVHRASINSYNGMSLTLECTLIGYPVPRVTWYRGDDVISCSDKQNTPPQCSLIQGMTSVMVSGKPKIFQHAATFPKTSIKMIVPTFEKVVAVQSKLQMDGLLQDESSNSYSCEARNQLGTSSHSFKADDIIKKLKKV